MFSKIKSLVVGFVSGYRTYLYLGLGVIVLTAGAYSIGHWKGVNDQKLVEAKAEAVAIQKGVQAHAQKQHEVIQLPDPDLDSRLDKWMRD